jgi:hypothetical protein
MAVALFGGGILLAFPVRADLFETIDFVGTGAGYNMTPASFSFLSLHEAVQVGDINNDNLPDVVILADGRVQANDYQTPGGWIPPTHYLYSPTSAIVAGSSSPNVLAGIVGAPQGGFSSLYTGGDLAWYENNGAGYFTPEFVIINAGGGPPEIYNGKNLQVADMDGDGDSDIVVWTGMGDGTTDLARGAGRVAWFEKILVWNGTKNVVNFNQHNVVDPVSTPGIFTVGLVSYSIDDPQAGTLADMNLDGKLDLVILAHGGASVSESGLYVFRNNAGGFSQTNGNVAPVKVGGAPYRDSYGIAISSADIDGDTFPDLVIGEDGLGGNDQELFYLKGPNGDVFSGQPFTKVVVNNSFPVFRGMTVADVIPGGCKEIIAGGNRTNSPISIFSAQLQGGNCVNWTQTQLAGANTLGDILDIRVADFNNDGWSDIVAFSDSVSNPPPPLPAGKSSLTTLWLNSTGTSAWSSIPLAENGTLPAMTHTRGGGLAVEDFDRDGDLDIVRSHMETNLAYFENNWNTERHVQIMTSTTKNGFVQKVISYLYTLPSKRVGRILGQEVGGK